MSSTIELALERLLAKFHDDTGAHIESIGIDRSTMARLTGAIPGPHEVSVGVVIMGPGGPVRIFVDEATMPFRQGKA